MHYFNIAFDFACPIWVLCR